MKLSLSGSTDDSRDASVGSSLGVRRFVQRGEEVVRSGSHNDVGRVRDCDSLGPSQAASGRLEGSRGRCEKSGGTVARVEGGGRHRGRLGERATRSRTARPAQRSRACRQASSTRSSSAASRSRPPSPSRPTTRCSSRSRRASCASTATGSCCPRRSSTSPAGARQPRPRPAGHHGAPASSRCSRTSTCSTRTTRRACTPTTSIPNAPAALHAGPHRRSCMRVEADPATGYTTAKAGTETVILGADGTRANIGDENDGRNLSFATCMNPKTANGTPVRDCIAVGRGLPHDRHGRLRTRRVAVRQQRRRLELRRRRPAGPALAEPRQPRPARSCASTR